MAEGEEEGEPSQWIAPCDDCDNPVEHYCKTCGDKLCTGCKDQHLSRKKNRHHKVVPYSEGMRASKSSTCPKHPSESLQVFCKPCQIPICTPCITETHSNHEFISIADAFSAAKEKATIVLKGLLTHTKPAMKQALEDSRNSTKKIEDSIRNTESEMKQCAHTLHQEIDQILEQNLQDLHQMRDVSLMPPSRDQEEKVVSLNSEVEMIIKKYEDNLRSENPIDLIMFMKEESKEDPGTHFPISDIREPILPSFRPATISTRLLQEQFGTLKLESTKKGSLVPSYKTHSSERQQGAAGVKSTMKESKNSSDVKKVTTLSLMSKPKLKYEVCNTEMTGGHLTGIRCQSARIWIGGPAGKFSLTEKSGKIVQAVDAGCPLYYQAGMHITSDNELIFTNCDGKRVMKVSSDLNITSLFATNGCKPYGLYQHNEELMVCLPHAKVVRIFTTDGQVIRDIGMRHLQYPWHVVVNKINNDICVSDNKETVVVFSSSGEKRFAYSGDDSPGAGFSPHDLCCDQLGNILITDLPYHRVHIIDSDGHFLQYLVSGGENISYPVSIDIDCAGNACVGENRTRKVKVFKYLR